MVGSDSELDNNDVTYIIHVEYNTQTIEYTTISDTFLETAVNDIVKILDSKHIPLTSPPHELFYNPDLPENVEIKQKRSAERLDKLRGSDKLLSPRTQNHPSLLKIVTDKNAKKKKVKSWRALASSLQDDIEIKSEIPEDEIPENEEDDNIDINNSQIDRLKSIDRRTTRSSSFDLRNMMDQLGSKTTLVRLLSSKRFLSYNLPNGSHLLLKSVKNILNDSDKPIFTGPKNFIRVYDNTGSYKTIFQADDTSAKYLYKELEEKFNITNADNYRIYLKNKSGLETMLGDNSTPIKLINDMDENELENIKLYFKDAGKYKNQSISPELPSPKKECIIPILESAKKSNELDLSFYSVSEYPSLFYELDNITNFTYNQSELKILPKLNHFTCLRELRLVNNLFKDIPNVIFDITSLTELDLGNNLISNIPNEISQLSNLQELYFYVNQIKKLPQVLSKLDKLRVFNFSNNYITSIPKSFMKAFPHLQQLKLAKNNIKELPKNIGSLKTLIDLNLAKNNISIIPKSIGKLINLRWINLECNNISNIPNDLSLLCNLEEIILSNNNIENINITLESINTLVIHHNNITELNNSAKFSNISVFNCSYNKLHYISEDFLAQMKKLTKLSLSHNELEILPNSIEQLHFLTQLDCKHNNLKELPINTSKLYLKVLDIGHNKLTSINENIWSISSLWFLQATNNPIINLSNRRYGTTSDIFLGMTKLTNDNLSMFSLLRNIRTLDIGYANIKSIPSSILKLKSLVILVISGNKIKSLPKEIGKLLNLKELYASCNNISSLPSSIKHIYNLQVIDISCNNIKSISELSNILSLQYIDVSYNNSLKSIPNFNNIRNLKAFHVFGCPLKTQLNDDLLHLSHYNITLSHRYLVSIADMRGRRDSMEDSMVIRGCFNNNKHWDYFCILDGHGGRRVAEFGGEELASRIQHNLLQTKCSNPIKTLQIAFKKVQEAIKATHIGIMEGSTVVLVLIIENELYIANVGDSRAVLSQNGKAIRLSYDHKPELPEEEERICKVGGFVSDGRINSILAVSRVIGDFALEKFISSEPYINKITLSGNDEFIILACDGVWDVMDDQFAVDCISSLTSPLYSASLLRNYAYSMGSMDNISCCVIHLKIPQQQDTKKKK